MIKYAVKMHGKGVITINVLLLFFQHNLTASKLYDLVVGCGISGGELHI